MKSMFVVPAIHAAISQQYYQKSIQRCKNLTHSELSRHVSASRFNARYEIRACGVNNKFRNLTTVLPEKKFSGEKSMLRETKPAVTRITAALYKVSQSVPTVPQCTSIH